MLHARAGMYRLTPPVVARRAPRLTCPRYGSPARGVELACSAWRRGVPLPASLTGRVVPVSVFSAQGGLVGGRVPGHRRHTPWGLGGAAGGEDF